MPDTHPSPSLPTPWPGCFQTELATFTSVIPSIPTNRLGESCGATESTLGLEAVILVSSSTSDTAYLCDLEQVTSPLCASVSPL